MYFTQNYYKQIVILELILEKAVFKLVQILFFFSFASTSGFFLIYKFRFL